MISIFWKKRRWELYILLLYFNFIKKEKKEINNSLLKKNF